MIITANLGFPRIGLHREQKKAQESYWQGKTALNDLQQTAANIRKQNWLWQKEIGINHIPSNDFSFYDQVLDTAVMLGAIPERYQVPSEKIVDIDTYFAMARGGENLEAMEMSKWFDTNYHYIIPELKTGQKFFLGSLKIFEEFEEAKQMGINTRPVVLGPVSFLMLSKMVDDSSRWELLPDILKIYNTIFARLEKLGAEWLQIDEPCLVLDLGDEAKKAYKAAYDNLKTSKLKFMLTTYFEKTTQNLDLINSLSIAGLHIDLVRGESQLQDVCAAIDKDLWLSLGLVDGRNIWKSDFTKIIGLVNEAKNNHNSEKLIIAPSCSLLHTPISLETENNLDTEIKSWLSFAKQKLEEVAFIADIANNPLENEDILEANAFIIQNKKSSPKIHNLQVKERIKSLNTNMLQRKSSFADRIVAQKKLLDLPLLPTTTIGSLPQTKEVREARAAFKRGDLSCQDYEEKIKQKIIEAVKWQEDIGIDVLVHGEFERNDMVEYFGEQLDGFAFTQNGWVQSYGSRCVKPPIILGDVSRKQPMTVKWSSFAMSQTKKPLKAMLTGPITILQWSFVRNDILREDTCKQIALAIRDETCDLEKAGFRIIQIDEPAFKEGMPLLERDKQHYLDWAVDCFHLCSCGVEDGTQIHTHMCYSEFNDIIEAIAALDADVISIEASRSKMEILDAFSKFKYPNQIGPGIYDIHSPRIPTQDEIKNLISKALEVLNPEQLWINPDCGLKTRRWEEVKPSILEMIKAVHYKRENLNQNKV
ncbi:MAG: 5-methyltetrahydropteroyltriglutamate--homocysteine S-methyltransferase [Alphaproteobacteria bacterium]